MKSIFQLCILCLVIASPLTMAEFVESWTQEKALQHLDDKQTLFVDVRSPSEYASGHVPGAINIPFDQITARIDEVKINQDKTLVLYCRSGRRAQIAESALSAEGVTGLYHLAGDMGAWEANGLPIEK